ncbi:MAG: hypothetical protein ACK59Y_05385 [Betaproteobacteria bacterium]|jgi:hypothetical protein
MKNACMLLLSTLFISPVLAADQPSAAPSADRRAAMEKRCAEDPDRCKELKAKAAERRAQCEADPSKCREERRAKMEKRCAENPERCKAAKAKATERSGK